MTIDSFSKAWEIYQKNLGAWILLELVLIVAASIIPLLGGLLLLPNVLREAKAAIREDRAPEVGALFHFENMGDDFVTMLLYFAAQCVGALLCCVGQLFAWIGFWYSAELIADGRVSTTDALRGSFAWVKQNPGDTIVMAVVSSIIASVGASVLGIGLILVAPLIHIAWAVHWQSIRQQVYELIQREGITVTPDALPDAML